VIGEQAMVAEGQRKAPPKYPVLDVPLSDIVIDADFENVRIDRRAASDDPAGAALYTSKILALAEDIQEHGLFHPLTVRQRALPKAVYLLRAGFRRYWAILLLQWGEVQASIIPPTAPPELDYWINIQENLEREDLGAYEIAEAALRMQRLFGRTGADFAKETKRSPSYVNNLIRWRRTLPQPLLDDWRRGHPNLTQERLEKLSHLNEAEAIATWGMIKGHIKIPVSVPSNTPVNSDGGSLLSVPDSNSLSRAGLPKRPNLARLADLKAAIINSGKLKNSGTRDLCLQIVEFCEGARKTIPDLYPRPAKKK
jgi:ParB/RepB/Spo0J family partition protein